MHNTCNMLIPNTLFDYIMNSRGTSCFSLINLRSVCMKRSWARRSKEEREAYSAMRSRVQKQTAKNNPHLREIRAKNFREVTQKYWNTVSKEKKKQHIEKMSAGMKKGWDSGDPNFGPRISNKENLKFLSKISSGNIKVIKDLPRINDYCGVLTSSQMAELNGEA